MPCSTPTCIPSHFASPTVNPPPRCIQTRHPRVLSFEWTGETTSGGDTVIYLVTEPVTPLPTLLEELALDDDQRVMYLALGLRQAAQAVAFLANQCKLMHGNVCTTTVLVTPELDWKLGFLDMASEHAHLTSSLLARCDPGGWCAVRVSCAASTT